MKHLYCLLLLTFGLNLLALGNDDGLSGRVTGVVIDKANGETLIGVPVMIEGTTLGAVTDLDGRYLITNIPNGTYNIVFRYIGYTTKIIRNVAVQEGSPVNLDVSLENSSQQLNEVVVTADMKRESVGSIILMQKKSATVQDGISAETIRKTPDKNTGEVVRRISGASIQEGRFVIIRGLNERYNGALLNVVPLASSEPDRKAFSFDLFPANMLDNLIIVKTASPELPGEFSGGLLQLNTRDIPDQNFFSFSAGTGLNTISTFKKYRSYQGGKTDWLGFDDGTRALPSEFPQAETLQRASQADKIKYSKLLPNDWATEEKASTPLTQTYQASIGRTGKLLRNDFGLIASISYSNGRRTQEFERADYDFDGSQNFDFQDQQYRENVFWGALLNASYKIGDRHKISFKNLYSDNAEDMTIQREGIDIENQQYINAFALRYSSTRFLNSILSGEHALSAGGTRLKWNGSYTEIRQDVPDLRRMYYYRNLDPSLEDTTLYAYVPFGTASPNYAGKFYSDLGEKVYNGDFSLQTPLKFLGENQTVKFGFFEQYKSRSFDARVLGYVITNAGQFNWNLLQSPIETLFNPENMGPRGFRIDEITNPSDAYTASTNLHAGFIQFDNLVHKNIRLVWGVRVENFIQKLNSFGYSNDTIRVRENYTDLLPSINVSWSLSEKTNLRIAASQTVARPEFRELAPFSFYDFSTASTIQGNDTLVRTRIKNFDLRYEYYPAPGEILSASVFYKDFTNPIEPVVESSGAGSRRVSFWNAGSAYAYGLELEWRKKLEFVDGLLSWNQWENFSLYGNVSLIRSRVDVSNDPRATGPRPLQGQSPYVLNGGLQYQNPRSGLGVNVVYNRIGRRIFQVGNQGYLSIEETPRDLIDLQISKRVFTKGEVRLTIGDLLNQAGHFYQDQNKNGRYAADIDTGISSVRFGTNINLTLSYKL
ncbi:TonB-dependent receptor domain-containing protein [Candidatus Pollutiaquabacter sp.]|uniref:TonB-dependent receptor n=1 Tax=Candidatus Pollutiaquabacter sp. TaxID=3416354 RepID=UPI003CA7B8CE|nr:TonB-dependent receptor [Bacteroidota bacterium]